MIFSFYNIKLPSRLSFGGLYAVIILASCSKIQVPSPDPGEADFTKVVAIGGNYLAGYQDGALYYRGQLHSIPNLLAGQFNLTWTDEEFRQPYMPDMNINTGLGLPTRPWESDFVTKSSLGYKFDCEGEESLSPLKSPLSEAQTGAFLNRIDSADVNNLAVPFASLRDMNRGSFGKSYNSGNPNPYYYRFASDPGNSTVIGDAVAQNPTFLILWLGMEEIYNYASNGGYGTSIPSVSEFESQLDSALIVLTTDGAKGAIANIPAINNFPFYTLIPYNGAELTMGQADSLNEFVGYGGPEWDHIHFIEGDNAFIIEDENEPTGYRHLEKEEYVLLNISLDSIKCHKMGLMVNPLPDRNILDKFELQIINNAINGYNNVISQKANEYGLALADMSTYFSSVQSGMKWNGVDYNMEFVSGGFLSLDGYHPNQKGYAMIANEFIYAINEKYNSLIPTVNCFTCDGVLFP